jgi:hypothetical protein
MLGQEASPLLTHVMWHPLCAEGPKLARSIYLWLTGPIDELRWSGLGIPVRYRTSRLDPISIADVTLTVVIQLVDANWVADRKWRELLGRLFIQGRRTFAMGDPALAQRVLVLPVMLHPSAAYLRELRDCTMLLPDPPYSSEPGSFAVRGERIRRQITQALGRRLLASRREYRAVSRADTDEEAGAKPSVFISHAKQDGAALGRELREAVVNYGQLRPFFDENDLPHGFRSVSAKRQTTLTRSSRSSPMRMQVGPGVARSCCSHDGHTVSSSRLLHIQIEELDRALDGAPIAGLATITAGTCGRSARSSRSTR